MLRARSRLYRHDRGDTKFADFGKAWQKNAQESEVLPTSATIFVATASLSVTSTPVMTSKGAPNRQLFEVAKRCSIVSTQIYKIWPVLGCIGIDLFKMLFHSTAIYEICRIIWLDFQKILPISSRAGGDLHAGERVELRGAAAADDDHLSSRAASFLQYRTPPSELQSACLRTLPSFRRFLIDCAEAFFVTKYSFCNVFFVRDLRIRVGHVRLLILRPSNIGLFRLPFQHVAGKKNVCE